MRILLTNDDGVLSPVLHRAAEALCGEHDLVVAAPAADQSGKSHAFTHGHENLLTFAREAETRWPVYRIHGTPGDCVKFCVSHLLRDRLPDLVLSGPNLGENAGVCAVYSGTVAAAREAALWGIPALAVSLSERTPAHVDFSLEWLRALLRAPGMLPTPGSLWNINFPPCPPGETAGARFTRMSTAMFRDHYVETVTAHGIPGWRLEGRKPDEAFEPDTDDDLLRRGHIAVVPLQISQTGLAELARLKPREAGLNSLPPARPAAAAA